MEFAQIVYMCLLDLDKAYDQVPRGVLWDVFREYGVDGLMTIQSLYCRSQSLVHLASSKSDSLPVRVDHR